MTLRLPDFLIIGAQKAGTTTLYRDLETHPQITFSYHKEPHCLCRESVLTPRGRRNYAQYFAHAREGQLCGEASTGYTKIPQNTGIAERAARLFNGNVRLLYIVRDPVDRAVSHHHHVMSDGSTHRSIDEAVRADERFIAFGCYAMQAAPWLERFGADRLRIIVFEQYMSSRREGAAEAQRFLGVTPRPELIDPDSRHNTAEHRYSAPPLLRGVARSQMYSHLVRRWIPGPVRGALARGLLPAAPARPAPPSAETVELILERTRDDRARLAGLLGLDRPVWDEDETRRRWEERRERHAARQAGAGAS